MAINNTVIKLEKITKTYKTSEIAVKVLKGITLTIKKGDFIAITGRSGSGKSTLMNIIGLLDTPSGGKYYLNNTDVTTFSEDELAYFRNKEIGFVFQSFNLLPRATILENVSLPAIYAGLNKKEREQKGKKHLEEVGLIEYIKSRPNQLSGGQQQRVAIARSLMNEPSLILADEPTGNLDTKSGDDIMKLLKKLNEQGKTILLITHEKDIANRAKKIITLKDGVII